jgi:hypothetical protein
MAKKRNGAMGIMAVAFEMPPEPPAYGAFPKRQNQGQTAGKMDFVGMIEKGESPRGFRAQTANGTASDQGTGWNRPYDYGMGPERQVEPKGPWQDGPNNRTGE